MTQWETLAFECGLDGYLPPTSHHNLETLYFTMITIRILTKHSAQLSSRCQR
jgi:hypothetical protein